MSEQATEQPARAAISARWRMSASAHTRPVGLCGLLSSTAAAPCRSAAVANAARGNR